MTLTYFGWWMPSMPACLDSVRHQRIVVARTMGKLLVLPCMLRGSGWNHSSSGAVEYIALAAVSSTSVRWVAMPLNRLISRRNCGSACTPVRWTTLSFYKTNTCRRQTGLTFVAHLAPPNRLFCYDRLWRNDGSKWRIVSDGYNAPISVVV